MKKVYRIRQKWLAWKDRFFVFDESGSDLLYQVATTSYWLGGNFSLRNPKGVEKLKSVREGLFFPSFGLEYGDKRAVVKRDYWSWFSPRISVWVEGKEEIEVTGSFFAYEFTFNRNGRPVATVSKKYWSWTDSYGLEVESGPDDLLYIGVIALIDFWFWSNVDTSSSD